jgi:hypothetical protein
VDSLNVIRGPTKISPPLAQASAAHRALFDEYKEWLAIERWEGMITMRERWGMDREARATAGGSDSSPGAATRVDQPGRGSRRLDRGVDRNALLADRAHRGRRVVLVDTSLALLRRFSH